MGLEKKLVKLSIKQKVEILDKLKTRVTVKYLCKQYDLHKSTITRIKQNEDKIRNYVLHMASGPGKRQTLKLSEYPRMEASLYKWFCKQREKNVPISVEIVKAMACKLHEEIKEKSGSFHASNGWMTNFKKRYNIRHLKICGEKLSNNSISVNPFKIKLKQIINKHDLLPDQIYNADEAGLFFRQLPENTLVGSKEISAPGRKVSKERITFLACTNASGTHKVKLLLIGKAQNPRALKNFTNMPVIYRANNNAWMTSLLFENWFHQIFVPEVRRHLESKQLPKKALLILDNAPCHPKDDELKSDDGMITIMCLPPNCTAILQPMDQNIINLTKRYYKKSLLAHLVADNNDDLDKKIKNFNLKHAICLLANAWQKISVDSIRKCWRVLLDPDTEWSDEDNIPLSYIRAELQNECELVSAMLAKLNPNSFLKNDSIEQWLETDAIESNSQNDSSEEFDEDCIDEEVIQHVIKPKIKASNAVQSMTIFIQWAEENELPISDILKLKEMKEKAVLKSFVVPQKQLTVLEMFKNQNI